MGYLASCSDEHIRKDIVRKVGSREDRLVGRRQQSLLPCP